MNVINFWCGTVNLKTGVIEETHTYEEAEKADFHVHFYFSEEQIHKMDNGECAFFCIDDGRVTSCSDFIDFSFPIALAENFLQQLERKTNELNTLHAIDTVCLNCVEDTLNKEVCESCPVRKLNDSLDNRKE